MVKVKYYIPDVDNPIIIYRQNGETIEACCVSQPDGSYKGAWCVTSQMHGEVRRITKKEVARFIYPTLP